MCRAKYKYKRRKLLLVREGEKSRKQSIYVKNADGNLPDSEEFSNNWIKFTKKISFLVELVYAINT